VLRPAIKDETYQLNASKRGIGDSFDGSIDEMSPDIFRHKVSLTPLEWFLSLFTVRSRIPTRRSSKKVASFIAFIYTSILRLVVCRRMTCRVRSAAGGEPESAEIVR